jgi:hypothetical protein
MDRRRGHRVDCSPRRILEDVTAPASKDIVVNVAAASILPKIVEVEIGQRILWRTDDMACSPYPQVLCSGLFVSQKLGPGAHEFQFTCCSGVLNTNVYLGFVYLGFQKEAVSK